MIDGLTKILIIRITEPTFNLIYEVLINLILFIEKIMKVKRHISEFEKCLHG